MMIQILEDLSKKRPYRLSNPGEVGQNKPKVWFKIFTLIHIISLIPSIIIFIMTDNPGIMILHFPIMMFIFFAAVSFGSDHVVYLD